MKYKEYQARTLDEAITAASVDLGVASTELYYEIINKGSSGILGFGKKDVTIKACKSSDKDLIVSNELKESNADENIMERPPQEKKDFPKADITLVEETAKNFLDNVFRCMELDVNIDMNFSDKDNTLSINIEGNHMGIIIGKRGQTLDSLQYLVNLAINKKSEAYIRVKLDTEDYRRRRKDTLENLAKNVAHKVKQTGHPVKLEAMNPYERRTIHYALQKDDGIETCSEGDEPYRHVVIKPIKK